MAISHAGKNRRKTKELAHRPRGQVEAPLHEPGTGVGLGVCLEQMIPDLRPAWALQHLD
jgi:hypothetical protein